jgi:hypothetical protein
MKSNIMDRYKALNLCQSPNLHLALADACTNNKVLLGAMIGNVFVEITKVVMATHPDWVWINAEHTLYSLMLLVDMVPILFKKKTLHALDIYTFV